MKKFKYFYILLLFFSMSVNSNPFDIDEIERFNDLHIEKIHEYDRDVLSHKYLEIDKSGVRDEENKSKKFNSHCDGDLVALSHSSDPCCINPDLPPCGEMSE